ncbi:hypothetical protein P7C70_g7503, partial [Phenoliferia sp. Uapishka_3]
PPPKDDYFTPEQLAEISNLTDISNKSITDRDPPHKSHILCFPKCLRIITAILIIIDQPYGSVSFACAVEVAERAIHDKTEEVSLARVFWCGRCIAIQERVEEGDRSVPFSNKRYTSSIEALDSCFTFRDTFPIVNDFIINFKSDGYPRKAHFTPSAKDKPSGPVDRKTTINAAQMHAFNAFSDERARRYAKRIEARRLADQEGSPNVRSRSASPSANSQEHNDGFDEGDESDVIVVDPPVQPKKATAKRRITPLPTPFQSRLGKLAMSDDEIEVDDNQDVRFKPRPTPRKSKSAPAPLSHKQDLARTSSERALTCDIRSRIGKQSLEVSDSDSSALSGCSDDESVQGSSSPYKGTLKSLHKSRMEPAEGITALKTYRMAQETLSFDKKKFKRIIDASFLPIHPKILEVIAKNEPFDFACLNANKSAYEPEHLAISALPGVFTSGKPPSRPYTTAIQWAKAWKLYCLAQKRRYSWELQALQKFGDWFIERLDNNEDTFEFFINFFNKRFPRVGTPGNPETVDALILDTSAIMELAYGGTGSSAARGKASASSSSSKPIDQQICERWNFGDNDHGDCKRRHEWEQSNQGRGFEDERKEHPPSLFNSEDHPINCFPLAGTKSIPRLCRNLHFPVTTKPISPSVENTLTSPPLPSVPPCVLKDPFINAALRQRPDLFSVSTPIDIPRFKNLLSTHPNRPLVESVLHGLDSGFWPGQDGNFSKISDRSGPSINLDVKTLDFLAENSAKDYKKGYLSEPFQTLLPGMHVSPTTPPTPSTKDRDRSTISPLLGSMTTSLGKWPRFDTMLKRSLAPLQGITFERASYQIRSSTLFGGNRTSNKFIGSDSNALCVYASDSGKVASGPMHDLVWSTYRRLADKKVDLRVRHISGEENRTADFLSRGTFTKLALKYGASLTQFAPPTHYLGGPQT